VLPLIVSLFILHYLNKKLFYNYTLEFSFDFKGGCNR
jgi:hypothetical protein